MPRLIPLVVRSLAVLALFAAATAALLSLSGSSPSRARAATVGTSFPRPTMNNPITIPLHVGSDSLHLDDSRDYILVMPSQKKTGPLYIRGGHDVEVIGGYMSTTTKGPNINISDDSGTQSGRIVQIEGVLIDGSSGVPDDTLRDAVSAGIVKVNIGTALNVAYTKALRQAFSDKADPRPPLNAARAAVADTVAHLLDVVAG